MKTNLFSIISIFMLLILGACTKMETETIEKEGGSSEVKIEVLDQNLEHQVKIEQSFTDNQKLSADIAVNEKTEKISKDLPFRISYKTIADIKRNSTVYPLLDSKINAIEKTESNGMVTLSQQFCFDFPRLHLDLETQNTKFVYKKGDKELELIYTELDSIKFVNADDKVLDEEIILNDTTYIRHLTTLNFKIYRHETVESKKFAEDYSVVFNTLVPKNAKPEEDTFEGMSVVDGFDKLYFLKKDTYRAERKIRLLYSLSGAKDSLLVYDYIVKSWTDKEQPAKIVPTIEIGNPQVKPSPSDSVYTTKSSYIVTRTTNTWRNAWTIGFATNIYTISEAAKFVKSDYTIEMPKADWNIIFKTFIAGSASKYSADNKEYDRYNTKLNWEGDYNKDKSNYEIPQIFDIEKGLTIVTITSITIGKGSFVHVRDNEYLSTQPITISYSNGKKEDTALSLKMYKTVTTSGEEILDLTAPMLNFSNSGKQDGEVTTENKDKFVISNHTRIYTFKHEEKYIFTTTAKYQTAVWVEGAFKVEMPSSESTSAYERFKAGETPTEISKNGKNYLRYQCESKVKETYNGEDQVISVPVKIDVEKAIKPNVTLVDIIVKSSEYTKLGTNSYKGTYIIDKIFSDGSRRDSTLIFSKLLTSITLPALETIKRSSADFNEPQVAPSVSDLTSNTEGNFTFSSKQKTFNCNFGNYSHKITTSFVNLLYSEGGISITLPTPTMEVNYISNSKGNPSDVTEGGKNYQRYPVVFNYTSNFDKFSSKEIVNLNVDVEKATTPVTITSITKGNGSFTHLQGNEYKSDLAITIYYSDGKKDETALSVILLKSTSVSGEQILTLASPTINYLSNGKDDEVSSEKIEDYTISSYVRTYKFKHREEYTFTATANYQKAVCNKYEGFPIEMPSSESIMTFSSYGYDINSTEVTKDGKVYLRYQGTTKVKEQYNKVDQILDVPVKIDVEKADEPDVLTSWEATEKRLEMVSPFQYKSSFKLTKVFSKSGTTITDVSTLLNIKIEAPMLRRLVVNSAETSFISGLSSGKVNKGIRTEDKTTITTYQTTFTDSYIGFENRFIATSEEAVYVDGGVSVNFLSSDWSMTHANFTNTLQGVVTVDDLKYNRNNFAGNISATYNGNTTTHTAQVDLDVIKKVDDNTPGKSVDVDATRKYGGVTKSWDFNNNKHIVASVIYKEGIEIYVDGVLNGFYDWTQVGKPETFVDPSTNLVSGVYDVTSGKYVPSSIATNTNGNWDYIGRLSGREIARQVDKSLAILDLDKTPYLKYGRDFIYRADGVLVVAYDNWVVELSID